MYTTVEYAHLHIEHQNIHISNLFFKLSTFSIHIEIIKLPNIMVLLVFVLIVHDHIERKLANWLRPYIHRMK